MLNNVIKLAPYVRPTLASSHGLWPYGDKPSWVCTSNELEILEDAKID
jgi:hypothetical protein